MREMKKVKLHAWKLLHKAKMHSTHPVLGTSVSHNGLKERRKETTHLVG